MVLSGECTYDPGSPNTGDSAAAGDRTAVGDVTLIGNAAATGDGNAAGEVTLTGRQLAIFEPSGNTALHTSQR